MFLTIISTTDKSLLSPTVNYYSLCTILARFVSVNQKWTLTAEQYLPLVFIIKPGHFRLSFVSKRFVTC